METVLIAIGTVFFMIYYFKKLISIEQNTL